MPAHICSDLMVTDNIHYGQEGQNSFFVLSLERPPWESWLPGQFVMIKPQAWGREMLWARPISISRVTSSNLILFIQVVGRGTKSLSTLKTGDLVTIWGPLGTGFVQEANTSTLLLARGMGIAPFTCYVDTYSSPDSLSMLFGHRLPIDNYPTDFFSQKISFKSRQENSAQDLLAFQLAIREAMELCKKRNGLALACGPFPFIHYVWTQSAQLKLRTQLSLEQKMACGIGACLGCVTVSSQNWPEPERAGLPVQTCTKGPVFWADQIDLDAKPHSGA